MEAVINDYISRELVQDTTLPPLGNATPVLETGVLDDVDLAPEHFAGVVTVCAYLRSRAGARAGQESGHG